MKNSKMTTTVILAAGIVLGLLLLGLTLKAGIDNFTNKDRRVTVKGLSEMEVPADKVTWPIQFKEVGNDMQQLYAKVNQVNETIKEYLKKNGLTDAEISVNPPSLTDLDTDLYTENKRDFRYSMTSTITISSKQVDLVHDLVNKQGDLLELGVAVQDSYVYYDLSSFQELKPKMMTEAIENAEKTAKQFAENSHSTINKIITADQGQFSIEDRDDTTPNIKKVRVVSTITYSLKD